MKLGYAHGPFITDDTQMTLFAAEGIIRRRRCPVGREDGAALVREVQAAFLRWLSTQEEGTREVASSPAGWLVAGARASIIGVRPGNDVPRARSRLRSGRRSSASVTSVLNDSKGCGAVMRAAPFGLAARTREQAFRWARDTGAITHGHPSGYLSAGHFAAVIWGVSRGEPLVESVAQANMLLEREPRP